LPKIIDLSITNRQNGIFNGTIIIDLSKNHRVIAIIDLNYRTFTLSGRRKEKVTIFNGIVVEDFWSAPTLLVGPYSLNNGFLAHEL